MTRPVFVVICGINGAGKSTLADALARSSDVAGMPFLNPDRLSASYRVTDPALSRDAGDIRALRHIAGEIHRRLAARQSFLSETVGANAAYCRYIECAKAAGYLVRVVFVGLGSAEQSIARVALRGQRRRALDPDAGHPPPLASRARQPGLVRDPRRHAGRLCQRGGRRRTRIIARVRAGRIEMLDVTVLPSVTEALAPLPR